MKDQEFDIYGHDYGSVSLYGKIENDCMELTSLVFGEDYDSEKHYSFNKENTEKLFRRISLEDFIQLCRQQHLIGMEAFLKEKGIEYGTYCY